MDCKGLRVRALDAKAAAETGIRPGDRILRVNGHPVEDELDYRFYAAGEGASLLVQGRGQEGVRRVRLSREGVLGIAFAPMRSRRCRNRCLFCFVDQLPDGLRRSLYVKDEDYRFSFLYGNYVTLSSVKDEELDRICRLRLDPMYVSVHATEPSVRNFLLGRKKSRDVMEVLQVLAAGGITIHTQVVLCPGINDGRILEKTVLDLAGLFPAVASIAVVPVGLTRYREGKGLWPIRGVGKDDAKKIINRIHILQKTFKQKYKENMVFPSDELYRLAEHSFPPAEAYGDFAQWENGVGMVSLFLREWRKRRRQQTSRKMVGAPDCLIVTGEAAYPFVLPYVEWLRNVSGATLRLVPVRNRLFGRSVNVTGLVAGRDVIDRIRPLRGSQEILFVPDVMLSRDGARFLDDVSLPEIREGLGMRARKFSAHPTGFERVLRKYAKGL